MAKNKVVFHCGCGFKAENLEEAVEHCEKQNHTLTAHGTVEPENK